MTTLTDVAAAFQDVGAGARVVAGNACGTPVTLLRGLARHAEQVGAVTLTAGIMLGDLTTLESAARSGAVRLRSWHIYGPVRHLAREGLVDYLPIRLFDLPETVLDHTDVALIRVGPPDASGYCSLGPSTSFALTAAERARMVIGEVGEDVPRTLGDSRLHVSRIHRLIHAETPTPEHRSVAPDDASDAVAHHVAGLVPDGATLQLGIGAIGEAVACALESSAADRALSMVGLVTDAMIPLAAAIIAAGRGPIRAIELMGGPAIMAFADDNPGILMRSSRVLHNPVELAKVPRLVSINSAIAVDLSGQAVAESVGGRVIAGVGGSADFAEGAHLSEGGMRIITLKSTTRSGASTIVAAHDPADTITAAQHSVDAVVTEHGVAWLRGRTRDERMRALVEVAAPEHREALASAHLVKEQI